MTELVKFLIFFSLGAIFSLLFWWLKKVKFSRLSRFAVDFSLSISLFLAFYALNFVINMGELAPFSLCGITVGLIAPKLVLPNSKAKKKDKQKA